VRLLFSTLVFKLTDWFVRRKLQSDTKDMSDRTPSERIDIEERRLNVVQQIQQLRSVQAVYMPAIASQLSEFNIAAEHIPLLLPSAIEPSLRTAGSCYDGLADMEVRLRVALCEDSLETVRSLQRGRGALIRDRNRNARGQRENARVQTTMKSLQDRCLGARDKYEGSRRALVELRGPGIWQKDLPELRPEHLATPDGVTVFDENTRRRKSQTVRPKEGQQAEGRRTVSWIWTRAGAIQGESDELLHEG
jgi:hypothetical protein